MTRRWFLGTSTGLGVGVLLGAPPGAGAPGVGLTPTGRLRVAVDATNTGLATQDPAGGEWAGVHVDLARAMARRLGAPVAFVASASVVERDAAAGTGAWDVASDSRPPEAAAALGWAAAVPSLDLDHTPVVGPDSAVRSVADMDRPGVRLGALSGPAPERNLRRLVARAGVVRTATGAELVPLLRAGRVDALVAPAAGLLVRARQRRGPSA